MQFRKLTMIAAMVAALGPAAAKAQTGMSHGLLTPYGEYFLVGGGVTQFFNSGIKDHVETGGLWDVRLGFGSRFLVGGEVAYVGSARSANSLGTNLIMNGAEGVLRLQYPLETGRWLIEPFAFGGGGWTHFDIRSARLGGAAMQASNDLFVMPMGGGMTVAYDHILFDTRFTYRQTFSESLIRGSDGTAASLKNWAITASVGCEF